MTWRAMRFRRERCSGCHEYVQDGRVTPQRVAWSASIDPYRRDRVEALEWAAAHGARAGKWIPSMMGIIRCRRAATDSRSARARRRAADHPWRRRASTGRQRVARAQQPACAAPRARSWRPGGDRRIARAWRRHRHHIGSNGPRRGELLAVRAAMDDPRYDGGSTATWRRSPRRSRGPGARADGRTKDWHGRLLNGSDYPSPGYMPAFRRALVDAGFLDWNQAQVLREIRGTTRSCSTRGQAPHRRRRRTAAARGIRDRPSLRRSS